MRENHGEPAAAIEPARGGRGGHAHPGGHRPGTVAGFLGRRAGRGTFRQLATHLGRGHRWAAQIVATRATAPIPMREVADGKLPQDPAQHAIWLNAGANRVIEAVTAAGSDLVWTLAGVGPASFWARRRAHEAAVHLADAQLAAGRNVDLAPEVAADGVDEWLARITAAPGAPPTRPLHRRRTCAETARACIFTPPTPGCPAPASGWSHVHRPARPRQSRCRGPRARSQPPARPDPSAAALRSRHRNPRPAGTAPPLAPSHAVLTDPRSKPTTPSQRHERMFNAVISGTGDDAGRD